jgi:transcriptional regulator with XRE-family HTH domain
MQVNIPIGKLIQEEVFKMNISLQELSERVNIQKRTLLIIFNCKSMDLNILYRWCYVLKIDFFIVYTKYLQEIDESIELETSILNSIFEIY